MTKQETLMTFPCDFQLKIMGKNSLSFCSDIAAIARKHYPTLEDSAMKSRPSQKGTYLAISLTVHALDQTTLDALYIELTAHPDTKMVL